MPKLVNDKDTLKKQLLLYLYDRRTASGQVEINQVFKDCGLELLEMRSVVLDAGHQGLIEQMRNHKYWGERTYNTGEYNLDNAILFSRLTDKGEIFVEKNYLPKPEPTPTIQADKVIYNTGTINGDIAQTDNQLFRISSQASNSPTTEKQNNAIQNQIIKWVVGAIGLIASLIGIYQWLTS